MILTMIFTPAAFWIVLGAFVRCERVCMRKVELELTERTYQIMRYLRDTENPSYDLGEYAAYELEESLLDSLGKRCGDKVAKDVFFFEEGMTDDLLILLNPSEELWEELRKIGSSDPVDLNKNPDHYSLLSRAVDDGQTMHCCDKVLRFDNDQFEKVEKIMNKHRALRFYCDHGDCGGCDRLGIPCERCY